jgi:hypothetical protein
MFAKTQKNKKDWVLFQVGCVTSKLTSVSAETGDLVFCNYEFKRKRTEKKTDRKFLRRGQGVSLLTELPCTLFLLCFSIIRSGWLLA